MNGFILVIPVILIRYLLLHIFESKSLKRAAFIPKIPGKQRIAYWVYEISTLLLIFFPCFLKVKTESSLFYIGLILYGVGIILCIWSTSNFAKPMKSGINLRGLYKYSRNPMYIAYFIYFLGCVLLTYSLSLLLILITFQVATHWIIIAEEKWCQDRFGNEYIEYMKKVRRYL